MNIVATQKLEEALSRYPQANNELIGWYQILNQGSFYSEHSMRSTFGGMHGFDYQYRFPIPGSTLQVHALVNFESQVLYIDQIKPGTH